MTKTEAVEILREVQGYPYSFMKLWGISTVREAVRTLSARVQTESEHELLEELRNKLLRKY